MLESFWRRERRTLKSTSPLKAVREVSQQHMQIIDMIIFKIRVSKFQMGNWTIASFEIVKHYKSIASQVLSSD